METSYLCLILALMSCSPLLLLGSTIELKPNPLRPSNPQVWLRTRREETSYEGPLHQFETAIRMQSTVLKVKMNPDTKECFYYVLLAGYQMHLYISTISSNQPTDAFDVSISNGDGDHIKDYVFQTTVSHQMNVTENDNYEICVYNPAVAKTISYSSYHYLPTSFEKALQELAEKNNITIEAENSIVNLELSVGRALNDIQNQPHASRDFKVLQDTNAYVQWKAVFYICLMLLSFSSTTFFIRRLFNGQRSSV